MKIIKEKIIKIKENMKYPKLRELKEAVIAIFSKRYTTRFPKEPHVAADGFRGKPVPDDEWCIGCEACTEGCPSFAIEIEDKPREYKRLIKRKYDQCNYCGECERICPQPSPGVVMSKEYNFPDYTKDSMKCIQEFELLVCGKCGGSVGTRAQLLATAKRMGPALAATNPEMYMARQPEIGMTEPEQKKRKEDTRADMFIHLCPSCRHKVYNTDAK